MYTNPSLSSQVCDAILSDEATTRLQDCVDSSEELFYLRKGNLNRETESLLISAQNKAIRPMSKQELTRRNKIADVAYVVIETKRSIT